MAWHPRTTTTTTTTTTKPPNSAKGGKKPKGGHTPTIDKFVTSPTVMPVTKAAQAASTPTPVSSSKLAFTGTGQGLRILALVGSGLLVIGATLALRRPRLRRLSKQAESTRKYKNRQPLPSLVQIGTENRSRWPSIDLRVSDSEARDLTVGKLPRCTALRRQDPCKGRVEELQILTVTGFPAPPYDESKRRLLAGFNTA